jgi:two-component system KDP operon response regulator KdpE
MNQPDSATILVVDDEPNLLRLVRANLERIGYQVQTARSGPEALEKIRTETPDLVILDVMMPGMDGYTVCERIRATSSVPIIMLTAKSELSDKVRGFELGADDYLTKPFGPEELLARVKAVLRRTRQDETRPEPLFVCGDLTLDFAQRKVTVRGQEVKLSRTEYKLLHYLAKNVDRVLPHEDILRQVWGPEYRDETEYLWVYIRYLRQKIEEDSHHPKYILSEPGVGYMLKRPVEPAR